MPVKEITEKKEPNTVDKAQSSESNSMNTLQVTKNKEKSNILAPYFNFLFVHG